MVFAGLKRWVAASAVLSVGAVVADVSASTISLAWDPSPSGDAVEYRVYVGTSPGQYSNSYTVPNATSYDVTNLVGGTTYHFAVSAVNREGLESDLSDAVSGVAPESGPSVTGVITGTGLWQLRVQGEPSVTYRLEQSDDFRQWTTVVNAAADSQGVLIFTSEMDRPRRFFRVRQP